MFLSPTGTGNRSAVPHHDRHDQVRIFEGRSVGIKDTVTQYYWKSNRGPPMAIKNDPSGSLQRCQNPMNFLGKLCDFQKNLYLLNACDKKYDLFFFIYRNFELI
jgi:hypothetical protein